MRVMLLILLFTPVSLMAQVIPSAWITWEAVENQPLTYDFMVHVQYKLGTDTDFSIGEFNPGEGEDIILENDPSFATYQHVTTDSVYGLVVYTFRHTYSKPGNYRVSFRNFNREAGVENIDASVNTPFYVEAIISTEQPGRSSPVVQSIPAIEWYAGQTIHTNLNLLESEGHVLRYEQVTPKQNRTLEVDGYSFPEGLILHEQTGQITWTPTTAGKYTLAVVVNEYQPQNNTLKKMGSQLIDITFTVNPAIDESIVLADTLLDSPAGATFPKVVVPPGETFSSRLSYELLNFQQDQNYQQPFHLTLLTDATLDASLQGPIVDQFPPASAGAVLEINVQEQNSRAAPYPVTVRAETLTRDSALVQQDFSFLLYTAEPVHYEILPDNIVTSAPTTPATSDPETRVFYNGYAIQLNEQTDRTYTFSLVTVNGKRVKQHRGSGNQLIRVSSLKPGIYFYNLLYDTHWKQGKIVITR